METDKQPGREKIREKGKRTEKREREGEGESGRLRVLENTTSKYLYWNQSKYTCSLNPTCD